MKFIERPFQPDVYAYLVEKKIPEWVAKLLARRIHSSEQAQNLLNASLSQLPNPNSLPDITVACQLLIEAIDQKKNIVCVVDYDTDGISSGAILLEGLRAFDANVTVMVTNRFEDGYGFSVGACQKLLALSPLPDVLITADLGSSDGQQIKHLQSSCEAMGHHVSVIVTDHHHISAIYPPFSADAFINPHRNDVIHSYHLPICGAMVAWNLIAALRAKIRTQFPDDPRSQYDIKQLLDLVAVATIGDMVSMLEPTNRAVVKHGLALINAAQRPSWQLLKEHIGVNTPVTEDTIGFQISPRINALSRMGDDGHTALAWLTTRNMSDCQQHWIVMNQNNDDRKDEQALCERLAMEQARQQVEENKFIIICHVPEASHGVVGLAAGRVANTTGRPAIVFSDSHTGQLTGSARSIPGYDIRLLIERTQSQTELVSKYGGHAAAAGLTIESLDDLSQIKSVMNALVVDDFNQQIPIANILHDGDLPDDVLTTEGLKYLMSFGPFGQGFPTATFCLTATILSAQSMGKNGQHARLRINYHTQPIDAVWFNASIKPSVGERFQFALSISENHFRGNSSIQAIVLTADKKSD